MSIDNNGVVTNEMLARYDAGIKDIIAMRTAEKNPVRYKVVKSTSTGSQTYSFYKKDENDTQFVVDSASDAITVQDSINSTSKDPVNGVAVAAKFAEQMTTQNINSIIGYTPMNSSLKGAANGVASLDGLGQVPTSQLPLADSYSPTGTKPVTGTVVAAALATLPEPMVFKGTVGTGGTVTSLPTAATSNKGHTYKAITANVTSGSKIGDTFISTGSEWVIIPSGDEPSGTVTQVGINASSGSHLSASGTVTSSGNLTVGVESGYQIPSSSDVSQITTNKTNILYGLNTGVKNLLTIKSTFTINGLTSVQQSDGYTVKITGTPTGEKSIGWSEVIKITESGTYKVKLTLSGTNASCYLYDATTSTLVHEYYSSNTYEETLTANHEYVMYTYSQSAIDATISAMLCTAAAYAQSADFQPPALPNYDLTRLEAEDRASLAEVVDSGAKNLFDWASTIVSNNNATGTKTNTSLTVASATSIYGNCSFGLPKLEKAVRVVFSFSVSAVTTASGSRTLVQVYDNDGALGSPVVDVSITGTGKYELKWNAAANTSYYIFTYPSRDVVQSGNTITITDLMLATKAAFGVSTKFVPYTKSNSQLTTELGSVKTVLEAIL